MFLTLQIDWMNSKFGFERPRSWERNVLTLQSISFAKFAKVCSFRINVIRSAMETGEFKFSLHESSIRVNTAKSLGAGLFSSLAVITKCTVLQPGKVLTAKLFDLSPFLGWRRSNFKLSHIDSLAPCLSPDCYVLYFSTVFEMESGITTR